MTGEVVDRGRESPARTAVGWLARVAPDALLPWSCVAFVLGRLIAVAVALPAGDGDRLWQYWLGERILREHAIPRALGPETFAAPGVPWIPQEWLFSTALAWTIDRGLTWAIPLACALAVGLALVILVLRCARRGISSVRTSGAVILCGLAMMQSFGVRAQVVGWAGVSLILWLLEVEGPLAWAAVPVTFVWANLHASAFLAPTVALLLAASALLRDRRWSCDAGRLSAIGAACALATSLTPLGLDLPRYTAGLLASPIRQSISEWGATSTNAISFTAGALPLLLILVAFGVRSSVRDRLVAVCFAVLLFGAVRNIPIFALAVAPIAVAAVPSRIRQTMQTRSEFAAAWVTVAAVFVATAAISLLSSRYAPTAESAMPVATARTLMVRAQSAPRVFCEDFAWCSIFLTQIKPVTFFMDGRCDPYPPEVWREYLRVLNGNVGWAAVLDRYRIDSVLVRRDSALDSLLAAKSHSWRMLDADALSRLYVRSASLGQEPRAVE